ncbi:DNA-deoxyinosine glycosylase [Aquabacterium sp.]|uniref:DNA-deoxyinosine glycosylase n=1 Tax=Aquabacterium sp. TaxID=1872578 RepID=UPI0019AA3AA2|nr:DNA-deoxyinosine glycosylase [Aquabacterium sp.]MBC7701390.1 DNA-deoxyinosine glycosylase [Aquabacterium sp.]
MSASPPPARPTLQGLPPLITPDTRLVVLGSFPSMASLAHQQYYAHPRNQFWLILSKLWGLVGADDLRLQPYECRLDAARAHGLGIWDVYAHCQRQGSLDSAIEQAQLNELQRLREWAPGLRGIAHNGGESAKHMRVTQTLGLPVVKLPSTSAANASWSFDRKLAAWREVLQEFGVHRT